MIWIGNLHVIRFSVDVLIRSEKIFYFVQTFIPILISKMRNIEIKAKAYNPEIILKKAEELSNSEGVIIRQCDTFFKVEHGRLKLRIFENGDGELICYNRSNIAGPKLCDFKKLSLDSKTAVELKEILTVSNGIVGVVKKTRRLFLVGQTRIHVDQVEGLDGIFMELEVVLKDDETQEYGQQIADDLMAIYLTFCLHDCIMHARSWYGS
ncbi:uncharacterized protein [Prorops nasuta]|uniref:uncharacterized protein isoform X2 n=1 Tax=Prorops nasuta TaxID=863751 RepID=UPI0034CF1C75